MLQFLLIGAIALAGYLGRATLDDASATALLIVGGMLLVAGLLLAVLGARQLGQSLSPFPRPSPSAALTEAGVYRRMRHPIYAGLILAAIGWSVAAAALLSLALTALLALVLDLKSRREEAWLRENFAGYSEYADRTSRFIPGVY